VKDKESSGVPVADIAQAAETTSLCVAHEKKIVDDVLEFLKLDASMLTFSPRRHQPKRYLHRHCPYLGHSFGSKILKLNTNLTLLTQIAGLSGFG
jgi:hypothetical protein